jgi:colanic acid biosynthesis glycosyl transferase WcaI
VNSGGSIVRRILILTQYYYPEPGAPQVRLRAMAKELRARGIEVTVLTGMPNYPLGRTFQDYRGKLWSREQVDGVQVHRVWLYPAGGRGRVKRLLNYLTFTLTAGIRLLFVPRVDLVFVEAQPLTLALPALVLKHLRGIPYVYNTPDLQVEIAEQARWIGLRSAIKAAVHLESWLMKAAVTTTSVTQAFIDHFIEHRHIPRQRMTFLPNGADVDVLRPLPYDRALAERLGVTGRTVFTYAGTHAHYQGLEVIVEAAKQLVHRPDIVILMVGQGPMRQRLIEMAAEAGLSNIVFRDSPFDETPGLMSITYASLVTLRDMPAARKMRLSKAIPPLACGVPVIYAGLGETADILVQERCGMQVPPENAGELARAIEHLADDPDTRREMGSSGRALAEREFSWRTLVANWIGQVEHIMSTDASSAPTDTSANERPGLPRSVDAALSAAVLVLCSPVLAVIALLIAATSPGPVLFRHTRIGQRGGAFTLLKFRTMYVGAGGPAVTRGGDPRVTPVGRFLRQTKLDEIPQLWNVLRGDMALVGPRPEAAEYVDVSDVRWREVLRARPGVTDPMTLRLRNEESLLARVTGDHEHFYRQHLVPFKLAGYSQYLSQRTWRTDLRVLGATVLAVIASGHVPPLSATEIVSVTKAA